MALLMLKFTPADVFSSFQSKSMLSSSFDQLEDYERSGSPKCVTAVTTGADAVVDEEVTKHELCSHVDLDFVLGDISTFHLGGRVKLGQECAEDIYATASSSNKKRRSNDLTQAEAVSAYLRSELAAWNSLIPLGETVGDEVCEVAAAHLGFSFTLDDDDCVAQREKKKKREKRGRAIAPPPNEEVKVEWYLAPNGSDTYSEVVACSV